MTPIASLPMEIPFANADAAVDDDQEEGADADATRVTDW